MVKITEKEIEILSKELGESKGLLKWRKSLLEKANNIPKEKRVVTSNNQNERGRTSFIVNSFIEYDCKKDSSSLGVKVLHWDEAMKDTVLTQTICEYLNRKDLPFAKDRNMATNAALFAGGRVVIVSERSAGTVALETRFQKSVSDILFVIVEKNAQLSLFDKVDVGNNVVGRTIVVIVEEDSRVKFQSIVKGKGDFLNNKISIVKKNADAHFLDLIVDETSGEFYSEHFLMADQARITTANVLLGKGSARINVCDTVHHKADNTRSFVSASGVGGDASHITYQGLIEVKNGVRGVEGIQKAKFLMISPNAKIDAIPALGISSKDISCSHSVSISYLQDKDLYYPKLRGIGEKKAKQLMISALLNSELSLVREGETGKCLEQALSEGIKDIT